MPKRNLQPPAECPYFKVCKTTVAKAEELCAVCKERVVYRGPKAGTTYSPEPVLIDPEVMDEEERKEGWTIPRNRFADEKQMYYYSLMLEKQAEKNKNTSSLLGASRQSGSLTSGTIES